MWVQSLATFKQWQYPHCATAQVTKIMEEHAKDKMASQHAAKHICSPPPSLRQGQRIPWRASELEAHLVAASWRANSRDDPGCQACVPPAGSVYLLAARWQMPLL